MLQTLLQLDRLLERLGDARALLLRLVQRGQQLLVLQDVAARAGDNCIKIGLPGKSTYSQRLFSRE